MVSMFSFLHMLASTCYSVFSENSHSDNGKTSHCDFDLHFLDGYIQGISGYVPGYTSFLNIFNFFILWCQKLLSLTQYRLCGFAFVDCDLEILSKNSSPTPVS